MSNRYSRPVVFIDMDDTIVDFASGIEAMKHLHPERDPKSYEDNWDEVDGIFDVMVPMPGAVKAVRELEKHFDLVIATTAPWKNAGAWASKVNWIHKHFDNMHDESAVLFKRLTITHNKDLLRGAYLIDDRPNNGAKEFGEEEGQTWIRFGEKWANHEDQTDVCLDWAAVLKRLLPNQD